MCRQHLGPSQRLWFIGTVGLSFSEMFVRRHWERIAKHFLSIVVTKRESTRQHEASSNLRAAQVSRQGLLKSTLRANPFSKVSDQVAGAWGC